MRLVLFTIAVACLLSACNTKTDYEKIIHDPILFSKTVHQLNQVVMGNNFSPIVASRNYTYASIAAYEVIAAGNTDKYQSLSGQLQGLANVPKAEPGEKIDFEFASVLAFIKLGEAVTFPEGSMTEYVDSIKKMATAHGMPAGVDRKSVV